MLRQLILFPDSPTLLADVPLFSKESLAMAERAVFLDRDNTIIDNDGYLGDPAKVKLLTGAATALSAIRALGYRLIVVSNQSGVARGMFDEAAVESVNQEMCRQLREKASAHIDASYYCPYHPDAVMPDYKVDHDWRKPKPGMLKQAAADFALDLSQCWTIGDMPRDIAAGAAAGTRTILLKDPDHPAPQNDSNSLNVSPNFIVKTLADAARIIAREGKVHPTIATPAAPPVPVPIQIPATINPEPIAPLLEPTPKTPINTLTQHAISPKLEKTLDDLVIQLRQQNRNADLLPEFTMTKLSAMILQIIAIIALLVGLFTMLSAPATFTYQLDAAKAIIALQRANIWITLSVMFQGAVIALLLLARKK